MSKEKLQYSIEVKDGYTDSITEFMRKNGSLIEQAEHAKKVMQDTSAFMKLQNSLAEAGDEIALMEQKKRRLTSTIASSKDQVGSLTKELDSLKSKYQEGGSSNQTLRNKILRTEKALTKQQESIEKNSETLLKHNRKMKKTVDKSNVWEKTLSSLQGEMRGYGVSIEDDLIEKNKRARESYEALTKAASKYNRYLKGVAKVGRKAHQFGMKTAFAGAGIATAATMGTAAVSSSNMLEKVRQANSYGMSYENYNAIDKFAQGAGLNGENVGDLIEEFRNKRGEFEASGEMSTYEDMMQQIGFSSTDFDGLNADQQLFKIIGALEKLNDVDQRASLADQLMGGEANKVLTYLDKTGLSFVENIAYQKQFLTTTNEMAANLEKQAKTFKGFQTSVGEGINSVSIAFASELMPVVQETSHAIAGFVRENGSEIRDFAHDLGDGVRSIGQFYSENKTLINGVATTMAGFAALNSTVWVLSSTFGTTISLLSSASALFAGIGVATAPLLAVTAGAVALGVAAYQVYENWDLVVEKLGEVKDFATDAFSSVGEVFDDLNSVIDGLGNSIDFNINPFSQDAPQPQTNNVNINVDAKGLDANQVAEAISSQFERVALQQKRLIRQ